MQISYTMDAFTSLINVVNFIESKNTIGAGLRWLGRLEDFLIESFTSPQSIKFCNNQMFNQLQLRCLNFNDWVIAFTVQEEGVTIEAILHSSRITD